MDHYHRPVHYLHPSRQHLTYRYRKCDHALAITPHPGLSLESHHIRLCPSQQEKSRSTSNTNHYQHHNLPHTCICLLFPINQVPVDSRRCCMYLLSYQVAAQMVISGIFLKDKKKILAIGLICLAPVAIALKAD